MCLILEAKQGCARLVFGWELPRDTSAVGLKENKLNTHPAIPLLVIYCREMKACVHIDLHLNVQSSLICNSLQLETTQIFINRQIDKQMII